MSIFEERASLSFSGFQLNPLTQIGLVFVPTTFCLIKGLGRSSFTTFPVADSLSYETSTEKQRPPSFTMPVSMPVSVLAAKHSEGCWEVVLGRPREVW